MNSKTRIEIAPVGKIGDGAVVLQYDPQPESHRSAFELHYHWDGDPSKADIAYIGGPEQARQLVRAINDLLEAADD